MVNGILKAVKEFHTIFAEMQTSVEETEVEAFEGTQEDSEALKKVGRI